MKKLIIVFAIIILGGMSCKEMCACSPAQADLVLILKNAAGKDVFDYWTVDGYAKDDISMYTEGLNGQIHSVPFYFNAPIEKRFSDHQIRVSTIAAIVRENQSVYLKLKNGKPYALDITISKDGRKIDRLLIDGKNIPPDKKSGWSPVFYFVL